MVSSIVAVVPAGKEALSEDVAVVVDLIDRSGLAYRLTPMGTVIEGAADDVWVLLRQCHEKMRERSRRVHTHITIDDREDAIDAIDSKVDDIKRHLGRDLNS